MKDFFQSTRFKILLVVFALLFAFLLRSIYTGGLMPFVTGLTGIVMTPVQGFTASVSAWADEHFGVYIHAPELQAQNEALREENRKLTEMLVDYEAYKNENDQLREFLEIKERNDDFVFEPATVVGRSPDDRFGSFTIDVGTRHGVSVRDPVVTPDGLIGIVKEVSQNYAKVSTILDASVDIGAVDSRTLDTGIVTGTVALSLEGRCKLGFLPRESGAAAGDPVVTSGIGGLLPKGLVVGEIEEIGSESTGLSLYAVVKPAADISGAKSVLVITQFEGKDDSGLSG